MSGIIHNGKFHVQGQTIIFCSCRLCAGRGVLGIPPRLEVFQGHSGVLLSFGPFLDDNDALSSRERIELIAAEFDFLTSLKPLFRQKRRRCK